MPPLTPHTTHQISLLMAGGRSVYNHWLVSKPALNIVEGNPSGIIIFSSRTASYK